MPKKKRGTAAIREEQVKQGAVFFDFAIPQLNSNVNWIHEWKAIEKYGFFVTTEECIMPYLYYRGSNKQVDNSIKGHIRACHFFFAKQPGNVEKTNAFGWPCQEQVSHLCHNVDCINPLHLTIESQWKNLKRNYCGFNGKCDCGVIPKCVCTYTNIETFAKDFAYEKDLHKVNILLATLKLQFPFKLLQPGHYTKEDAKEKARLDRKRRQDKHKNERRRKLRKQEEKTIQKEDSSSDE